MDKKKLSVLFIICMAMESFAPVTAYRVIFTGLVLCCIMGMAVSITLHRYSIRNKT